MQFTPSVYEHSARLIGRRPWEVSRDPELLFHAHLTAFRRYGHRPVVVGIDIYNLEAEAYGAPVSEPRDNGIPAILEHPFSDLSQILSLKPFDPECAGRIPAFIEVGRRLRESLPDADVRIPVSGPFSVLSNLLGFDLLLCSAALTPDTVRQALLHLVSGQLTFCRVIRDAGLDIAFFESAAAPPLLSPDQFREIELPALQAVIAGAATIMEHPVPCVLGGNTVPILPYIMQTGTGYVICPAAGETDQEAFLSFMAAYPEVMVRINMRPDITVSRDWNAIRSEVDRIVNLVKGRRNVCLGTGALPYETPPENIDRIAAYVKQPAIEENTGE